MTELITDEDIVWFEEQTWMQKSVAYYKITQMQLKLAKAVKELQDNG